MVLVAVAIYFCPPRTVLIGFGLGFTLDAIVVALRTTSLWRRHLLNLDDLYRLRQIVTALEQLDQRISVTLVFGRTETTQSLPFQLVEVVPQVTRQNVVLELVTDGLQVAILANLKRIVPFGLSVHENPLDFLGSILRICLVNENSTVSRTQNVVGVLTPAFQIHLLTISLAQLSHFHRLSCRFHIYFLYLCLLLEDDNPITKFIVQFCFFENFVQIDVTVLKMFDDRQKLIIIAVLIVLLIIIVMWTLNKRSPQDSGAPRRDFCHSHTIDDTCGPVDPPIDPPDPIPEICVGCTSPAAPTLSEATAYVAYNYVGNTEDAQFDPSDGGFWSTGLTGYAIERLENGGCVNAKPGSPNSISMTGAIELNDQALTNGGYYVTYQGVDLNDNNPSQKFQKWYSISQLEYDLGEELWFNVQQDIDPTDYQSLQVRAVSEWVDLQPTFQVVGDTIQVTWPEFAITPGCSSGDIQQWQIVVSVLDETTVCGQGSGQVGTRPVGDGTLLLDASLPGVTLDLMTTGSHNILKCTAFAYPDCNISPPLDFRVITTFG